MVVFLPSPSIFYGHDICTIYDNKYINIRSATTTTDIIPPPRTYRCDHHAPSNTTDLLLPTLVTFRLLNTTHRFLFTSTHRATYCHSSTDTHVPPPTVIWLGNQETNCTYLFMTTWFTLISCTIPDLWQERKCITITIIMSFAGLGLIACSQTLQARLISPFFSRLPRVASSQCRPMYPSVCFGIPFVFILYICSRTIFLYTSVSQIIFRHKT
jgi:predicted CxxxxCH...CXXCH cytochrome family protein